MLDYSEQGRGFVVLGAVRGTLGVEACGDLFPPFRRLFRAQGLVVEAREFFGDQPHGGRH